MGVFSFWELSFSGICIKLSKECDPPVWLVPSSNVSFPVLLCLFSFFIFFSFTQSYLFSLTQSSLSLFCVALERESKTRPRDRKLCRWQWIREMTSNWAQAGSWDTRTSRLWDRWIGAPFFGFGFFFFTLHCCSSSFGCGFPVHSFGFFVWLLEVLMVVESGFVVGGGDETGFGCGFHIVHVESRR